MALSFLMLHPVGISIERFIVHFRRQFSGSQDKPIMVDNFDKSQVTKSHGYRKIEEPIPPLWIRCVGFIWLAFWIALTAPYIVNPLCVVGVFSDPRVDLRRLMGY